MGIGVNTNQPSDLSSLNSGSDINTSNQPSDSEVDNFANLLGKNSSDSGEVNVHSEPTMPSPFTQPDLEEHAVGSSWGGNDGYVNAVATIVISGGGTWSPYEYGFHPKSLLDIECCPDSPINKNNTYKLPPEGLTDKIKDILVGSGIFDKLNSEAQDKISEMLTNMATGDISANGAIKTALCVIVDEIPDSDLSPHEKAVLNKVIDIACDVVAAAVFLAGLPESLVGELGEGVKGFVKGVDEVAHMAVDWWHDLKSWL